MPGKDDYYKILGVGKSAKPAEIKRAYRTKAKQYHPDRNPNDASAAENFQRVQKAYDVLGDPEKKSQYDQFGEAGVGQVHQSANGRQVYEWGGGSSVSVDDLEDLMSAFGGGGGHGASIFEGIFGGAQRRRRQPAPQPSRGMDQTQTIKLSFEQAIQGATVDITLRLRSSGKAQKLEVKIPPGVTEGQKIRLRGKGQPGSHGGPAGDLLLVCTIARHPYFERQGVDIYLEVPVSITEASLGARIEVPTLDGQAVVTLPPGTASGAKLRVAGKGAPSTEAASKHGDLYIAIKIVPPKKLTERQRSLLEEFGELVSTDPRADCGWGKG